MNSLFKKILAGVCIGILGCSAAFAIPASQKLKAMKQPDGSTVLLKMVGDEYFHCLMTEDGYLVKATSDGWYNYISSNGEVSQVRAMNPDMRTASDKQMLASINSEQLFAMLQNNALATSARYQSATGLRKAPQKELESKWDNADGHDIRDFPTEGEQKILIVLVNFPDKKFSLDEDPHAAFDRMLNEVGYDEFGATGSAYDFYTASSHGLFKPSFDVYGPVEVSQPYSYYGENDIYENDLRPGELVKEACELLDEEIDYTQYDRNNDGFVDNVYLFYAGYGEADTYIDDTIWPHAWQLQHALKGTITLDGVEIDKYAMSNEIDDQDYSNGIGTFCHEFAHVLGLPDLYSTVYNSSVVSPGEYSALDYGPYNNSGRTPPMFSIYEQYALEWTKPVDITEAATITLLPLHNRYTAYKINADVTRPVEYFLFENRQQEGWDKFIPGHGMLVWHIDYNPSVWENNIVNNTATHQYIDIVEADNVINTQTRAGDTFPGSASFDFNSSSVPEFINWNKHSVDYPITEIQESPDGVISFKVLGGGDESSSLYLATANPYVSSVSKDSFVLSWESVPEATGYCLTVYPNEDFDGKSIMTYVGDYKLKDLGDVNSVEITELATGKAYSAILYAYNDVNASVANVVYVMTSTDSFESANPIIVADNVDDTWATLQWTAVADADHYLLTVATRQYGESTDALTTGFDNKNLPSSDWQKSALFDSREKYCGENIPSLKFSKAADHLITPTFDNPMQSVSFWCRISREGIAKLQLVGYDKEGSMVDCGTLTEFSEEGTTFEVNLPDNVYKLGIYYYLASVELTMNFDDLTINFAGEITDTPVAGFDKLSVAETSAKVTGLEKDTEYVAYVTAVAEDATESKASRAISFRTLLESGIECVQNVAAHKVSMNNGVISLGEAHYDIYAIDGRLIAKDINGAYQLPAKGIYIVKTAEMTAKVIW